MQKELHDAIQRPVYISEQAVHDSDGRTALPRCLFQTSLSFRYTNMYSGVAAACNQTSVVVARSYDQRTHSSRIFLQERPLDVLKQMKRIAIEFSGQGIVSNH